MKAIKFTCVAALLAATMVSAASASGRNPGSVLIFPVHRSGMEKSGPKSVTFWWTVINVVNSNRTPETKSQIGGSTNLHYQYVNVTPSTEDDEELLPKFCNISNRTDFVTHQDLRTVLTACQEHYASYREQGPPDRGSRNWRRRRS